MCSGIELMSSSERSEILPAGSARFSLVAEASDAADEVELKRADIGPGKEDVAFHARPPASGVLLNLPYPPEGRTVDEDICKGSINIHAQSLEFAERRFIQFIGGNQPNDWSVGRQSIAAERWPELHHALSNRILPTLCTQTSVLEVQQQEQRKTDTQILFRRHFFGFLPGGRRGPGTGRNTGQGRIIYSKQSHCLSFTNSIMISSYLQCSAAMIRDGI